MSDPKVSIVILNYFHPEVIDVCLRQLPITVGVPYEVVVVDNGSDSATKEQLRQHKAEGRITTLVENPVNSFFSEGNNIGVRNSNPNSEYILLLNSDAAPVHPEWLTRLTGWAEGTTEHTPTVWNFHPTVPTPGPKDIISFGWSHDVNVEGRVRPEGWCCLIRRSVWQEMSPDFPFHYGFEEMISKVVRAGATCGVLWHYQPYIVHREGASEGSKIVHTIVNKRQPDLTGWFSGLKFESLDFTVGPQEHDSYLDW